MNEDQHSTDTLTAPPVTGRPQRTARTASPPADRPLRHTPRPAGTPRPPRPDEDEPEDGFFKRFRIPLIIGAVVLGGLAYAFSGKSPEKKAPVKAAPPQTVMIKPIPPPPPPPPPKVQPPPPKQEEKKIDQVPEEKPEAKPEPAKPKPVDEPAPLGTGLVGKGPGMSGLGRSGNGGGGNGTGGGSGDLFNWYAGQAARPVTDALRNHPRTKTASMSVVASIWVDGTGRIERARLLGSTGDAATDTAIQNEVLPGVRLSEAPPAGMKMPIKLRLNARRPK
jgi:protein TonB